MVSHEKMVFDLPETKPQLIAPTPASFSIGKMVWNVLPSVLAIYSVQTIGLD